MLCGGWDQMLCRNSSHYLKITEIQLLICQCQCTTQAIIEEERLWPSGGSIAVVALDPSAKSIHCSIPLSFLLTSIGTLFSACPEWVLNWPLTLQRSLWVHVSAVTCCNLSLQGKVQEAVCLLCLNWVFRWKKGSLLCAIVKSTKYSFDAEANEIYEEKTHWPYYLPVQTMLEAWIEDVTLWPPVEIVDIVLKFLEGTLGRN